MRLIKRLALASVFGLAATTVAHADDCSGRDHTAGTVLGAVGGAAIGGAASNNAGGAIAGAVVGGLAGNAIARAQDCNRVQYRDGRDDRAVRGYGRGYVVAPEEERYWGVDSYADFSSDYRRIQFTIERARDRGAFTPGQARRFSRELQRIQYRADRDQREGRFDPRETQARLGALREEMRATRQDNREERADYRR
jgi:hypothetical protein